MENKKIKELIDQMEPKIIKIKYMSALGKGLGSLIPNKVNIEEKKLNDNNLDMLVHFYN